MVVVVGGVVAEGIAAKEGGDVLDVQLQIFSLLGGGVLILGIVAIAHGILAKAIHTVAGAGVAHALDHIGAAHGFDEEAVELKFLLGQLFAQALKIDGVADGNILLCGVGSDAFIGHGLHRHTGKGKDPGQLFCGEALRFGCLCGDQQLIIRLAVFVQPTLTRGDSTLISV